MESSKLEPAWARAMNEIQFRYKRFRSFIYWKICFDTDQILVLFSNQSRSTIDHNISCKPIKITMTLQYKGFKKNKEGKGWVGGSGGGQILFLKK